MKQKLAYIDHSFHRKTGATGFLIDLLNRRYQVEVFWDESWNNSPRLDLREISKNGFDVVVFFQVINYPGEELVLLKDKEIVIIPMFDASPNLFDHFWRRYVDIDKVRFINFSATLDKKLRKFGFFTKHFQYFLPLWQGDLKKPDLNNLKGFFWQRTDQITWNQVSTLIKDAPFSQMHIHAAPDPPGHGVVLPSPAEKVKYNVEISRWFANRQDYFNRVEEADVYFAPRRTEGIGMSFLEAMARGKCVVAPNNPTLNEYIRHGETGYLYDPCRPKPLDFSNIEQVSANALKFVEQGYDHWLTQAEELLNFIEAPLPMNAVRPGVLRIKLALYFKLKLMLYRIKRLIKFKLPRLYRILLGIKKYIHF